MHIMDNEHQMCFYCSEARKDPRGGLFEVVLSVLRPITWIKDELTEQH